MKIIIPLILTLSFIACTKDDSRQLRYAKKQYYLGHDYFVKHIQSLAKIDSLRMENAKLEKEMRTLSLKSGQKISIASIRSSKKRIAKNTDIIKQQVELARRFLNAALTELGKVVIANPHHTQAHFELGLIYLKKATATLDMAKRAQCMTGDVLKEKEDDAAGLLAKAKIHFMRSLKNSKLKSKAHNNISAIEIHFGNTESAINHAKTSIADLVYRDSYVANSNIGWAHFHQKKYTKAISYFKQSLLLQHKYCLSRYRMGRAYFELGNYKAAGRELLRTVKQGPPCNAIQEAWLYLGLSMLKLSNEKEARFALSQCNAISKQSCVGRKCQQHLSVLRGRGSLTPPATTSDTTDTP